MHKCQVLNTLSVDRVNPCLIGLVLDMFKLQDIFNCQVIEGLSISTASLVITILYKLCLVLAGQGPGQFLPKLSSSCPHITQARDTKGISKLALIQMILLNTDDFKRKN